MKYFLKLSRAAFLGAVLLPASVGAAVAYRLTGAISPARTVLMLFTAVLIHLGANLLNDWFDFRMGADANNPHRTPFSGGSPDIAEGRTDPRRLLLYAVICFSLAAAAGAALMVLAGNQWLVLVLIGAAGVLLGIAYTAPPIKLSWRGLGEIAVFIAFGPLPVMAAMHVLAGGMTRLAWCAAFPLGLLVMAIIWINEFPDFPSDTLAGKRTLVVRLGTARARYGYHAIMIAACGFLAAMRLNGMVSRWIWISGIAFVMAARAAMLLHRNHDRPDRLMEAQALTIGAQALTGIALVAGILL